MILRRAFRLPAIQRGVTLIELMVAMILGLIVAGGIVTVFMSTSSSNRAQTQMARLQEEGRFAISRISDDVKMANAQYCSSTGGVAVTTSSNVYLDGLRTPMMFAKDFNTVTVPLPDSTTPWGTPYPVAPTVPYPLPSFLSMRGYVCDKTSCTPASTPAALPAMGTASGKRVLGASILTMRYIDSSKGWALGGASTATPNGSKLAFVHIVPAVDGAGNPIEPPLSRFAAGDLAMLADCSNAQVFAVTGQGGADLTPDTTKNLDDPSAQQPQSAPRLFNFTKDFLTVTYYLQVVTDDNTATGHKTGALMRCVNGACDELVRGVERLDFLYGVQDGNGNTSYLTADVVDTANSGAIPCPPAALNAITPDYGCLWRAVTSIEIHMVVDGQRPLYTLTAPDLAYSYYTDGIKTPQAPDSRGTGIAPKDQGFDEHMIRREFSALVMLRNYNP